MALKREEAAEAGRALYEAEKNREQIGLLSLKYPGMDMDDAYAVQAAFVAEKEKAGGRRRGWKIGLTSRAMQMALNIDTPDSGILFEDMYFDTGETIPADRFIQPRIEAEIAFILKSDIEGRVTISDVLDATAYVTPALEILDTRILRQDPETKKTRTIIDTISDNAANAGIITGGRLMRPQDVDLRWVGAVVSRNGYVEETGLGAGVLNNPILGIVWLAERLGQYGEKLRAGDLVLAGSFIRPIEAPHGSTITADYGPLGQIACYFA